MGQVPFCTPKGRLGPWRWVVGVCQVTKWAGQLLARALMSPTLPPQSFSAPRRDSTSTTRMLMGMCCWGKGGGLGRGRRKGPGAPQSAQTALGPPSAFAQSSGPCLCRAEGGGPAHPPACGVSPEQEKGPPWVRFFLGPFSPWRVGALRLLLPRPPPLGRLGGGC